MTDIRTADVMRASGTFAIAEGVFLILGGLMLVIAPFASVVLLTQFTGAMLLLAGIIGAIRAAGSPHGEHGSGAGILGPIIAALAGFILLIDPTLSAAFITKVLGAILLITGAMQIAAACGMRGRDQWTLVLGGGIVTVILGILVFMMPGAAILVFAIFTGVQLLFLGGMVLRGGCELRRVGKRS
ncbi:MAG: DUF308 domain-containing protein [Phycisphaerales bacterium]|jgi:uncharacterized membrane protein HdeD (DUF308 family)|nr:DUF308 domain-containing protein [Phycisphaerales bacterium]